MNVPQPSARIGPNAILQVLAALRARHGDERTRALAIGANVLRYAEEPPDGMVDEREVIALHRAVRHELGFADAAVVMAAAGHGTGDYLLAHRIPTLAQRMLHMLPSRISSRLLLRAIARHTWTFAGSGRCHLDPGPPVIVTIADCPACRGESAPMPLCVYYARTFERLYRSLVDRDATVIESSCIATGAEACRFEIRWGD